MSRRRREPSATNLAVAFIWLGLLLLGLAFLGAKLL